MPLFIIGYRNPRSHSPSQTITGLHCLLQRKLRKSKHVDKRAPLTCRLRHFDTRRKVHVCRLYDTVKGCCHTADEDRLRIRLCVIPRCRPYTLTPPTHSHAHTQRSRRRMFRRACRPRQPRRLVRSVLLAPGTHAVFSHAASTLTRLQIGAGSSETVSGWAAVTSGALVRPRYLPGSERVRPERAPGDVGPYSTRPTRRTTPCIPPAALEKHPPILVAPAIAVSTELTPPGMHRRQDLDLTQTIPRPRHAKETPPFLPSRAAVHALAESQQDNQDVAHDARGGLAERRGGPRGPAVYAVQPARARAGQWALGAPDDTVLLGTSLPVLTLQEAGAGCGLYRREVFRVADTTETRS